MDAIEMFMSAMTLLMLFNLGMTYKFGMKITAIGQTVKDLPCRNNKKCKK